jgi:hypothetical protein
MFLRLTLKAGGLVDWATATPPKGLAMRTRQLDFTSQDYFRNPAASIEELRKSGPVIQTKFPIVGKVWITTTNEAAGRVLKDSENFTLRKEGGGLAGL